MWAILAPLASSVLSFVLRTVIVKFLIMGAVFVVIQELLPLLIKQLPDFVPYLSQMWASLTPQEVYYLQLFKVSWGFPLLLSAYVARFAVRRIPFLN